MYLVEDAIEKDRRMPHKLTLGDVDREFFCTAAQPHSFVLDKSHLAVSVPCSRIGFVFESPEKPPLFGRRDLCNRTAFVVDPRIGLFIADHHFARSNPLG